MKSLSVIIPCFGQSIELEACLEALASQQSVTPFELIVVDSASDARVQAAAERFSQVRLIRSPHRLFAGAARNLGVRSMTGDGLAFLDADCVPSPDWVWQAYASLESGHQIIGGPVLDAPPVHSISWVDNHLQFADYQIGRQAGRGDHFPSCNLVMLRSVFDAAGGFREDVITGEDVLFTARVGRHFADGIFFNPRLVVRHHGRRTLRGLWEHQQSLGYHRARLDLAMTPGWRHLARSPWLGALAIMRRFGYICVRTWQYDKKELLRLALFSPLLFWGLMAWTDGFYRGVKKNVLE